MTFRPTLCPFCGFSDDLVANAPGRPGTPEAGDLVLCSQCRSLAVFSSLPDGYLYRRPPTQAELDEMSQDPVVVEILAAYQITENPLDFMDEIVRIQEEYERGVQDSSGS